MKNLFPIFALSAAALTPLAGCEKKTASEQVKDTAQDVKDGVKKAAEKTGDAVKDAADATKDAVHTGAEKVENATK